MSARSASFVAGFAALAAMASAAPLGPYKIDPSLVTVGGLSAGGFFSVQYHVAFSSEVHGAAIFAGGPYYCAQGSQSTALTTCMNALPYAPSVPTLEQAVSQASAMHNADDVSNLANARVFVYSGTQDTTVKPTVVKAMEDVYNHFVTAGNVTTQYSIASSHCMPTDNYGNACTSFGSPYINNCNYDGAGAAFKVLYPTAKPRVPAVDANLVQFDQTPFGASAAISMGSTGYVYVPAACANGETCGLHIHFHGCQQTIADIGDTYARHTGFNEWAEANNVIVLYPQVQKSQVNPSNPQGCFDWWGYTDANYAYKTGKQMQVVHKMHHAIMGISSAARVQPQAQEQHSQQALRGDASGVALA